MDNKIYSFLDENKITYEYDDNNYIAFFKDGKWFYSCKNWIDNETIKFGIMAELEGVGCEAIDDIVTTTEIAELLKKDTSTIRKAIDKAIENGILIENEDCRRAKNLWLLKKVAIKKMYPNITFKEMDKLSCFKSDTLESASRYVKK